jgi:hypothetical protein
MRLHSTPQPVRIGETDNSFTFDEPGEYNSSVRFYPPAKFPNSYRCQSILTKLLEGDHFTKRLKSKAKTERHVDTKRSVTSTLDCIDTVSRWWIRRPLRSQDF